LASFGAGLQPDASGEHLTEAPPSWTFNTVAENVPVAAYGPHDANQHSDLKQLQQYHFLGEEAMRRLVVALSGLMFALGTAPAARAQITIDVAKITCDQYNGYRVSNPQNIAIWLSGYYHGKRGETTLDTQALVATAKKVRDYCRRNPETAVMQAVETVLGTAR
jgi:hypothetical protein